MVRSTLQERIRIRNAPALLRKSARSAKLPSRNAGAKTSEISRGVVRRFRVQPAWEVSRAYADASSNASISAGLSGFNLSIHPAS